MYVVVYVCMYVRMYVCVYVCMYVCMYVCVHVCYLEISREPKHLAQQMRHQIVGLSDVHCLGIIKTFQHTLRGQICACAADIWQFLQYYWAD